MSRSSLCLITLAVALIGCGSPEPDPAAIDAPGAEDRVEANDTTLVDEAIVADEQIDWMIANTENYLGDRAWRRAQLEASLWRTDLYYAAKRLDAYGLDGRGWELLPEFEVVSNTVGPQSRTITLDPDVPTTRDEWLALGERVFWTMPMRRDAYLEWVVKDPELAADVGLETDGEGAVRGVVEFTDGYGDTRQGATCGLCHSTNGVPGQANETLDLGRARVLFGEQFGIDNSDYAAWGPGTVDVTDDEVIDALAIPNLWSVEHQTHLNASGAIELRSPAALAIRFETQYIVGHSMLERPRRVYVWALTMFVLSLKADTLPSTSGPGFDLFTQRCATCHIPERGYGGALINADSLNYDAQAAHSAYRGTGYFRATSLRGISRSDRFMHDARLGSLREVLDLGHPFGTELAESDKRDLLTFLETL